MKIEFVNHSGFIVEHNGCRIMCDPWIEDPIFINGWQLISPSLFSYNDFNNIDFLWFSHEHPDHFNPPNLNKIPIEIRKNISILFQNTIDKRVINYCQKAGFKNIIELYPNKWFDLTADFKISCEHFKEGDSWICFKTKDSTILNTNDCGIRNKNEIQALKSKIGKIDVLLTQFSYAYWAGNKDEIEYRKKIAKEKLEGVKFQCDNLNPRIVIPMASYVWFCHEENFYLNDSVNKPDKVLHFIQEQTKSKPIILYNGEIYNALLDEHNNEESIQKYLADIEKNVSINKVLVNKPIKMEEIISASKLFLLETNKNCTPIVKRLLKPVNIYISDYKKAFNLSIRKGLVEIPTNENDCDISLSSECLHFCFKYPYGSDSLQISGRFQKPTNGHFSNFHNLFRINQLKSRGIKVGIDYLFGVAVRKLLIRLKLYKP